METSYQLRRRRALETMRRPQSGTSSMSSTDNALSQTLEQPSAARGESNFSHFPLDLSEAPIRLIDLLPIRESNPYRVECEMIISTSISERTYEALSYEWGHSEASKEIFINGMRFFVRDNLWNALYDLREDSPRRLWIDALCIDQQNVDERNHQVRHMSAIYSSAHRVLVWLGQGTDQGADALRTIASINLELERYDHSHPNSVRHSAQVPWDHIRHMCRNSYWTRLWIVQEIGLARNLRIHWGSDHIEWDDFANCYPVLPNDLQRSITFQLVRQRMARDGLNCFLKDLLETCKGSLCLDPRDKVYGLLGLADDCREGNLTADYSKSLFDVYEDVIRFQYGNFLNGVSVTHEVDYCSIVGFSQQLQWILWHPLPSEEEDCTARLDLRDSPSYRSGDLMRIVGFWGGSVALIGPECSNEISSREERDLWIERDFHLGAGMDIKDEVSSLVESFVAFEATERGRIITFHGLALQGSVELHQLADLTILSDRYEQSTESDVDAGKYSQTRPHLFATGDGDIGIAPREAQPGDLVCRFLHCDVAVIVRSFEFGYKLIGRVVIAKQQTLNWAYGRKYGKLCYSSPEISSISECQAHMTFFLDMATLQLLTR
ncbi:heterokaryon incompatibility protein-domain-containing protein [Hyaloscypha finlandica]|nr:heterokaryon incompatibility protein-domain-containing protein [Hyaloscypha finlandica]